MAEPENLVLHLLREMREDFQGMREEMRDMRSEMHSLRADVASDLLTLEKRLGDQIAGMRRAVME